MGKSLQQMSKKTLALIYLTRTIDGWTVLGKANLWQLVFWKRINIYIYIIWKMLFW